MKSIPKSIRRCEIVSNLKNGDETLFDMDNLEIELSKRKCIKDYCFIIHDKDTYSKADEKKFPDHKEGDLKPPHIHLLLRFEDNQPQKLECVAKWFGVAANFANKINGSWEDACLYQIHKNAPDKFQYSPDEVTANFDYKALIENTSNLPDILNRILSGEIKEYNKTLEIDNMLLVMHAKHINEAFKVRSDNLQATLKDRVMECIFLTGASGCGKTTFAKQIAKEKGLDYFISSGSNDILDNYCQEPCIILDDIRPSSLGLSDLLKLLDNHTASSVKSRYKNKFLNCDLIILTTVLDIDSFYQNVFSEHSEPITQLKRRCGTYIRMDKNTIQVSIWDSKAMQYTKPVVYKNDILEKYLPKENKTSEDVEKQVEALFPFLEKADTQDAAVKNVGGFHLTKAPDELVDNLLNKTN